MKHGKNYRNLKKDFDKSKSYGLNDALDNAKKLSYANFDESIDVAFNLNLEKKHTIRGTVILPHSFGEPKKVCVITTGAKADEAKTAGADFVGADDLIEKIKKGWLEFDVCIATPDMMKDIRKVAKVLGPRGMMPNPKVGTVTEDLEKAIKEVKKGKIEYRADKTNNVHVSIGKKSMDTKSLKDNFMIVYNELIKKRPSDLKGDYMVKVVTSSTMGLGITIDLAQIK